MMMKNSHNKCFITFLPKPNETWLNNIPKVHVSKIDRQAFLSLIDRVTGDYNLSLCNLQDGSFYEVLDFHLPTKRSIEEGFRDYETIKSHLVLYLGKEETNHVCWSLERKVTIFYHESTSPLLKSYL